MKAIRKLVLLVALVLLVSVAPARATYPGNGGACPTFAICCSSISAWMGYNGTWVQFWEVGSDPQCGSLYEYWLGGGYDYFPLAWGYCWGSC